MSQIDIRRLDFGLLLVFAELMRHRKATVVADRLGLTQSSISHALGRLRDLLGDPLFLRRPAGMEPTLRALELEPQVRAILDMAGRLVHPDQRFDPATAEGRIRIGTSDHAGALILPRLAARLRETAPGLIVSSRPLVRRQATDALTAGDLDLALGFFFNPGPGIETERLFEDGYAVVARPDHPAWSDGTIDLAAYLQADHALVSYDGDARGIVDTTLQAMGARRRVVATVPSALLALALVANAPLVATLPRRLVAAYAGAFGLAVTAPPLAIRPFPLHLAWHERTQGSPQRAWVAEAIRGCVARMEEVWLT